MKVKFLQCCMHSTEGTAVIMNGSLNWELASPEQVTSLPYLQQLLLFGKGTNSKHNPREVLKAKNRWLLLLQLGERSKQTVVSDFYNCSFSPEGMSLSIICQLSRGQGHASGCSYHLET